MLDCANTKMSKIPDEKIIQPKKGHRQLQTTVDHLAETLAQGSGAEHQLLRKVWGEGRLGDTDRKGTPRGYEQKREARHCSSS